ncbi:MAG: ribosome recycling factor [Synergistetes bacterium]|nr:ribosome recycling factor [Synergistota bacterium]MCX8127184.1 ribosome recycling factor [Synergistota bacterium]MDW8191930.1 ribosome recycling factor [Synergistota bacterium]
MKDKLLKDVETKMKKAIDMIKKDMASVRTGRAHPALLEDIKVDYYGTPVPINQLATISVPEARLIVIQPWDKSTLKEIEKAILRSPLGLIPQNDGNVIRVSIPPLTEERRKELIRLVRKKAEEGRITVRNIRRDVMEELKEKKENGELPEDDYFRLSKDIQELTDKYIEQVEEILKLKEEEIMEG